LALLAFIFLVGVVVTLLYKNARAAETISFSSPGLITFLFGIALSGASIVLAIAAITLGKASEQAMIQRSDQSIRLQNEVFVKTTEALGRIESSTDVTEKRIEDIISGRAGELSRAIAERIANQPEAKDPKVLENEIRQSLLERLSLPRPVLSAEERAALEGEHERSQVAYRKFQSDTLIALAKLDSVNAEKIGDGKFGSSGDDLVDGIINVNGERIAVSSLSAQEHVASNHIKAFPAFLRLAAAEVNGGTFNHLLIVIDGPLDAASPYKGVFDSTMKILRPEIVSRIHVFEGEQGSGRDKAVQFVRSLATKSSPGPSLVSKSGEAPKTVREESA